MTPNPDLTTGRRTTPQSGPQIWPHTGPQTVRRVHVPQVAGVLVPGGS